ncbi:hypothetical protein KNP414_04135 [Paenibacillus mucilaginosus KNP414]|uniref:Uncharacterized protein n=1 Tax=Paenibacillus mucilaginosus (strain KNP414) TaxID=1036673 RepID=F8FFP0_PAEMK|nr:hypothetical protein KNP414_04135 [Paenibacillus mucilaginosus KNP414]
MKEETYEDRRKARIATKHTHDAKKFAWTEEMCERKKIAAAGRFFLHSS